MEEPIGRLECGPGLKLPSHALFIGATQSGKTRLCLHLLRNLHLFHPRPSRVLFHYDQFQKDYLQAKADLAKSGVELLLFKGCQNISLDDIEEKGQTILLIDDFSEETASSKEIARIATNGRHKNISLWLVWHSLFHKYPASRVIGQNVRYYFFLPSLRLESQLRVLGSQLGMKTKLIEAFKQATEDASADHPYLLLDVGSDMPRILRLRSHIGQDMQFCYV